MNEAGNERSNESLTISVENIMGVTFDRIKKEVEEMLENYEAANLIDSYSVEETSKPKSPPKKTATKGKGRTSGTTTPKTQQKKSSEDSTDESAGE